MYYIASKSSDSSDTECNKYIYYFWINFRPETLECFHYKQFDIPYFTFTAKIYIYICMLQIYDDFFLLKAIYIVFDSLMIWIFTSLGIFYAYTCLFYVWKLEVLLNQSILKYLNKHFLHLC